MIAQCPFTDGLATAPRLGALNTVKATAAGLRDELRALTGRPPHCMPAVGEPGSFAAMTIPESKPGMDALIPELTRWENRVAARIALRIATYRPGRRAPFISCPLLGCVCDRDSLAPAERTVALLRRPHWPRSSVTRSVTSRSTSGIGGSARSPTRPSS